MMKALAGSIFLSLGLASAPALSLPEVTCQWEREAEKVQLTFSFLAQQVVTVMVNNAEQIPETRIFMQDAKFKYVNVNYKQEDLSFLFPLKIFQANQLGKPMIVEIHGNNFESANCKATKLIRPQVSL